MKEKALLKKALLNDAEFKECVNHLKECLITFNKKFGIRYFKASICVNFDFAVRSHRKDAIDESWYCDIKNRKINYTKLLTITVTSDYIDDYINKLLSNISNIIVNEVCENNELCHRWEIVDKISVLRNYNYGYSFINNLIAWSYDNVGIWHVEQECGEGWITAPLKPNTSDRYIYITNKEGFKNIEDNGEKNEIRRLRRKINS